ncbi:Lsr2 family protein [Streptomyces sp. NPDC051840]|uniref:histone-like nucleoid-structuring protein Lsr2 n=1 Tax=Streptomyces sp. NPDC051840 TaxID=3154752 RepID=UPI00343ED0A0
MAHRRLVQLVDALNGNEPATEEVAFSLDGHHKVIALSAANAQAFRALMAPYVEASKPAAPDSLASKGILDPAASAPRELPDPNQLVLPPASVEASDAEYRRQSAAIREWAAHHGLTLNRRGRIPTKIREAWEQSTLHGERTLLDQLLTEEGIEPTETTPPAPPRTRPVPPTPNAEERLRKQAKAIKLSDNQSGRLRTACAQDGRATATDPADRTSYEALRRRGCMVRVEDGNQYLATDLGYAWVRCHEPALTA